MLGRTSSALLVSTLLLACAHHPLDAQAPSSADSASYALRYADELDLATKRFQADRQRAHDATSVLPAHARDLKPGSDRALLERVVDESDRSGRSQSYARSQQDERTVRGFWDDERGPLTSRVTAAAQKDVADAGCTQAVELSPGVQHALRDGVDKQLERRARAANEAQRTIEQNKTRLGPGAQPGVERLSDEVAQAGHLAHVALPEDVRELDRLLSERSQVERTLDRALEDERTIQTSPHKQPEQKASQDRVVQIQRAQANVGPRAQAADAALAGYEDALRQAQSEYDNTIEAIKASFRGEPAPAVAAGSTVKP